MSLTLSDPRIVTSSRSAMHEGPRRQVSWRQRSPAQRCPLNGGKRLAKEGLHGPDVRVRGGAVLRIGCGGRVTGGLAHHAGGGGGSTEGSIAGRQ